MRSFFFPVFFLSAISLFAAPMVRVIDVKDARTLIVDRAGVAAEVRLGDVVIPPGEETAAIEFLRTKVVQRYVMVESNARGEAYVYRSPDALFINGELLRRAYLSRGTEMIIVGESAPGPHKVSSSRGGVSNQREKRPRSVGRTDGHPRARRPRLHDARRNRDALVRERVAGGDSAGVESATEPRRPLLR
jgi:hypothetical protein